MRRVFALSLFNFVWCLGTGLGVVLELPAYILFHGCGGVVTSGVV